MSDGRATLEGSNADPSELLAGSRNSCLGGSFACLLPGDLF